MPDHIGCASWYTTTGGLTSWRTNIMSDDKPEPVTNPDNPAVEESATKEAERIEGVKKRLDTISGYPKETPDAPKE